ncbi:MAG: sigma-70 family RNA polymerase sigma factor [Planctomycetes bacterium]|nr:sigma-70 family RNA polymerase sigma factor [Planctomycetota bacterium]
MAGPPLAGFLEHVRNCVGADDRDAPSDCQLLQRFVARREESAFAALLQRHGPMVLRVCREVLGHEQAAEDAFQATFLVLARKAVSIRRHESLAAWLHRVALNIARTAKTSRAQRRAQEREAALMAVARSVDDVQPCDWQPLLHEEVNRLPEKYRVPVVLCYLEGKTHDEAAQQLSWPLGTVKGRLARARDLLRLRLARRGLTLTAAALAAALAESAAAAVPAPLLDATLQSATRFAAGTTATTGGVSARALSLANGALRIMVPTRLALVALFCLAAAVGAAGGLFALRLPGEPRTNEPPKTEGVRARTDLQGDPLPTGAIARLGTVRFRHGQHIQAIAFSPDGKGIASVGSGGSIVLHDAATGKKLRSFQGEAQAHSWTFAPDGKTLAAGVGQRLVCVWEVATGKRIRQFELAEGPVHYLAFSHDGRTLAGGVEKHKIQVWDVRAGKEIGRIAHPPASILTLALTSDGKTLATAGFDRKVTTLFLWDTAGGRELRQWQAHKGEVYSLAFSPDGKRLASASIEGENRLCVWAVPTGEQQFELPGAFHSLRFSPCGKVLAAAANGSVFLWEADTGKETRRLSGGGQLTPRGDCVVFSPDGRALAVADPWTITLWEVASGKQLSPSLDGHEQVVESVRFLADGKTIAATSRGAASFWHVRTGKRIGRFEGPRSDRLAISPDGKVLAVAGGSQAIGLWDVATGKKLREVEAPPNSSTLALVFSPDGKTLAAAIGDGTIRFWDVVTGKLIPRLALHEASYANLAFSPDGKTLVIGDGDLGLVEDHRKLSKVPTVRLLDAVTGRELRKPFELPEAASSRGRVPRWVSMGQVAFSADGKVLAAAVSSTSRLGTDPTIQVWEVATGRVLCRLERVLAGGGELSGCFALSPDGKSLVTVGEAARLWEVATGKLRGPIRGHSDTVCAAAFSPDGRLLATGSQDTTVLIWDTLNLNGE